MTYTMMTWHRQLWITMIAKILVASNIFYILCGAYAYVSQKLIPTLTGLSTKPSPPPSPFTKYVHTNLKSFVTSEFMFFHFHAIFQPFSFDFANINQANGEFGGKFCREFELGIV